MMIIHLFIDFRRLFRRNEAPKLKEKKSIDVNSLFDIY